MRLNSFSIIFLTSILVPLASGGVSMPMPKMAKSDLHAPDFGKKKEDVFIEADNMDYDEQTHLVTATGKVQILKGENVLFADKVVYNQDTGFVTADGNVSIVGSEGNALFTDHFVLKDDFNEGVIDYFRARLSDGSLIAAARAKRINADKMVLHKAVYSPCPICAAKAEAENTAPQWQIKANTVTIDNKEQEVTYRDATMEVYGVPVLYTPYFAHGTPNAPPSSGFLMPTLRTDSNLGGTMITPYYWYIAPNMDLTAEPVFTTKEGPVLAGQFRHQTEYGSYELFGSFTHPTGSTATDDTDNDIKSWRGHIKGDGKFDLSEHWSTGFDGEAASDDTYLKRYNYAHQDLLNSDAYGQDLLTSKAYVQRIDNHDYSSAQVVHFQGLLQDDNSKTIPLAVPYIQNHVESSKGIIPGLPSSVLFTDVSGFNIQRQEGAENQRISADTGINVPFVLPGGQLLEFSGSLRGDQYHMDDTTDGNSEAHRFIPEASVTWRYPLVNQLTKTSHLLVEPIVKLVVSPNRDYNRNIPNEDSQDVEFSDLNVFDNNRFRGLDRVESGPRLYYGLRGGFYENNYNISYLLGQDYRIEKLETEIPVNSGIEDNESDIVGRISASYMNTLDISYKFRFDKNSLRSRRDEIDTTLDMKPFKLTLSYFNLDYDFTDPTQDNESVDGVGQFYFNDQWSILLGGERNLAEHQNIDARAGILYEGDCTSILTTVKRTFLSDRDAHSGASVTLQLGLKNLGNI